MQKIALLYDASQAVLSTFDLDEVLQQILIIARDYFHLQNVAILLLDKETDELYPRSQIGWDAGHDAVRLPVGTGITGSATWPAIIQALIIMEWQVNITCRR